MKSLFLSLIFISSSYANFLPEDLELANENFLNLSQVPQNYLDITNSFHFIFDPEVSSLGGDLEIRFDMENSKVNAYATREGAKWVITFLGGMIKHRKFNEHIFSGILCHELGHHLAGAPFKYPDSQTKDWVSSEGQSDYYATNICLKKLHELSDNRVILNKLEITDFMKNACQQKFVNPNEYYLCLRSVYISDSIGSFLSSLGMNRRGRRRKAPNLETPDPRIVTNNVLIHPASQCRLDTYFQGSLCEQLYIGDAGYLNCHNSSSKYSGNRPNCWFFSE